jgi:hypothetical protein
LASKKFHCSRKAWANKPGAENCDRVTIRGIDIGNGQYIGLVLTYSEIGNDFDRYAAYLCPTRKALQEVEDDFSDIAEESGFTAAK